MEVSQKDMNRLKSLRYRIKHLCSYPKLVPVDSGRFEHIGRLFHDFFNYKNEGNNKALDREISILMIDYDLYDLKDLWKFSSDLKKIMNLCTVSETDNESTIISARYFGV